jgi:hypothetical protein
MPIRTVGYIVLNRDQQPMTWYGAHQRFFHFTNSAPTFFDRKDYRYEALRRLVGMHYQTVNRDWQHLSEDHRQQLSKLSIKGLSAPKWTF